MKSIYYTVGEIIRRDEDDEDVHFVGYGFDISFVGHGLLGLLCLQGVHGIFRVSWHVSGAKWRGERCSVGGEEAVGGTPFHEGERFHERRFCFCDLERTR